MHFTYAEKDERMLRQGDLLSVTEELRAVLTDNHPYFTKEQYRYFIVITQSCDLDRHDRKRCKSPYITLAAVRSFDDYIKRVSMKFEYFEKNDKHFLSDENAKSLFQLLERLYNNNEDGYFYLHLDNEVGLEESMVAFLKVSFALKAEEHYEECLKAKVAELSDDFKAKLGWMVGNMYARVGTKDWYNLMSIDDFHAKINQDLRQRFIIGEKSKLKTLKRNIESSGLPVGTIEELQVLVDQIEIETKYDVAMKAIEKLISRDESCLVEDKKEELLIKFRSNATLQNLLK